MPKRDEAPLGAPCWVDLLTADPGQAQAFYGGLFGWTVESTGEEFGNYVNFYKDGDRVAGCMKNDGTSGTPDLWNVYLATDDAAATVEGATALGGHVLVPVMPVADLGSMAMVTDAGQAAVGMWQPGTFHGFGVLAEPGAPGWFELYTRDYKATVDFYREVFGWDAHVMSDTDDFRYTTLGEGYDALAGIMDGAGFLPEGVPAHWAVYFQVEDVDKTVARAVELGGAVLQPAEDTPYGRLAQIADPTGAAFKLIAGS